MEEVGVEEDEVDGFEDKVKGREEEEDVVEVLGDSSQRGYPASAALDAGWGG
jgi:hypothetical protein